MLARALASHLGRARQTGARAFAQHVTPLVDPNAEIAPPSHGNQAELGEISGNPTNFLGRRVRPPPLPEGPRSRILYVTSGLASFELQHLT